MKYRNLLLFLLVILLGFIPLLNLFTPGFPVTHDGQDHIARIANFYKNLEEGVLIPRWAANLNWGYGHPILMFLYPLSSYITSLFHLLGFSFVDSLKIVFGVTFIASGITMYLWIRNFLGEVPAFIAGILYLFAPYRFVDLYVRGAIGEHVAFIFPPLVLYFFLKLSKKYSYWYVIGGSFSLAGFILSHNAISLMFLPFILFYSIYLVFLTKDKKQLLFNFVFILLVGFGISSFFWIPAFFEGKYTLRNIVIQGGYLKHFVDPKAFLYGPWNYGQSGEFTFQIGFFNLFSLLASLFTFIYLFKKKSKEYLIVIGLLVYTIFTVFLMTSYSDFIWKRLLILQNFQFPWRFLSVVVFTSAVLGGFFAYNLSRKIQKIILIILVAISIFLTKDYWKAKSYIQKPENYFTGIYYSTTDTGESAPIWSVRFMEQEPKAHLEVIGGNAIIKEVNRKSNFREYKVTVKNKAQFRENTLYFPGWEVLVDGRKVNIEFHDQKNRGVITFFVESGEHTIKINFKETKLRFLADIISLLSLLILIVLLLNNKLWRLFR